MFENNFILKKNQCTICNSKKWRFIKKQEAKGLLVSMNEKILILGPLLI